MAWIEIHQSLPRHRKVVSAGNLLDVPRMSVIGHMICLWTWALDNAPDGNLTSMPPAVIALGAEWEGSPEVFLAALIKVGFVDQGAGTLQIHNWADYAGKLIARRTSDRERKRAQRMSAGNPEDVRRKSTLTVPYRTVPNSTIKDNPLIPLKGDAQEGAKSEQKQSPRKPRPTLSKAQAPQFAAFWAAYPRKLARADAERAWAKLSPDSEMADTIIQAVKAHAASAKWRDGPTFIPYPATWLNGRRWEDEINEDERSKHANGRNAPTERSPGAPRPGEKAGARFDNSAEKFRELAKHDIGRIPRPVDSPAR